MFDESTKWIIGIIISICLALGGNYWATSIKVAEVAKVTESTRDSQKELEHKVSEAEARANRKIEQLMQAVSNLSTLMAASEARSKESDKVLNKLDNTVDKLSDVVSRLDERTKSK